MRVIFVRCKTHLATLICLRTSVSHQNRLGKGADAKSSSVSPFKPRIYENTPVIRYRSVSVHPSVSLSKIRMPVRPSDLSIKY